jgi:putative redox protein
MPEIRTRVVQVDDTPTSKATIRDHSVSIDRPAAKGGADRGAMGGELLLAALGGCFMSNLIAAVHGRGLQIGDLAVEVSGDLDGTPPVYQAIRMAVSGRGADVGELQKMVLIAERGCIVANTLKPAVPITTRVAGADSG